MSEIDDELTSAASDLGDAATPQPTLRKFDFDSLTPTDFEEFVFDLLNTVGFVNVDWRKGTPKDSSPSDRGRDIEAQMLVTDVDGHQRFERWFVDAKHYKTGVPPEALQGLAIWSQAERPDVALVAASGYLSNPAKDWIDNYRKNQSPPFRFKHWERPQLSRFISDHMEILGRHDVFEQDSMRSPEAIQAAELEHYNRRWYERSTTRDHFVSIGQVPPMPDELMEQVLAARRAIEDELGKDSLVVDSDWHSGLIAGRLDALRWVLGDEWGNMDT
jgi:HJR/Mrr/RecB family endonuclease